MTVFTHAKDIKVPAGCRLCPFCVGDKGRVSPTCEDCCGSGIVAESTARPNGVVLDELLQDAKKLVSLLEDESGRGMFSWCEFLIQRMQKIDRLRRELGIPESK